MKRRLFIAAIFLLAGAVVNVAVAWGCAAWLWPEEAEEVVMRWADSVGGPRGGGRYWRVTVYSIPGLAAVALSGSTVSKRSEHHSPGYWLGVRPRTADNGETYFLGLGWG